MKKKMTVEEFKQRIINGKIKVPATKEEFQAFQVKQNNSPHRGLLFSE
ncbi:hypothetical protein [Ectobacillus panaciterrae]|nr:hypothetical protein [Ectobacillus panaciterrae]